MGCCSVLQLCIYFTLTGCLTGLRFTEEPDDSVVALHQSLTLSCHAVDDTFTVQYRWTFNFGADLPLHENHVIYTNGSLLIRRVTADDVGDYVCMGITGETTIHSRTASIQLAYISPTFSVQPISKSVILGDNVTLSCYIDSLPAANISWTLDGISVTSGLFNQDVNGTGHLALFPVMYHHAGTYKCVGTNPLTRVYRYSNDAVIVVQGQPVFVSSPKPVTVPLNFDAKFVCDFHGNPEPKVTWLLHTILENGDISSKEIKNSDKYRVYDNGTFIIYNVTKEDEAFYTCNVGNVFGEISMSASLTVTGEATPPVFTTDLHNKTVMEKGAVSTQCECDGNPKPDIQWNRGTDILSTNGSLHIDSAQSGNTGWYTCTCENAVTAVWQSVYIDVYVAPRITRYPQDVRVLKFKPLYIQCESVGNPLPSIRWNTPRFGEINSSVDGLVLYQNGTLKIVSTSLDDTGTYTCTSHNIAGTITAASEVLVEVSPIMTTLPISQGVKEGSTIYMHCQATGIPAPSYVWSKDGEGVIVSTPSRQIFLNNTIVIYSVRKQDEGVYRCRADNTHGSKEAVATVTVSIPPNFVKYPQNETVVAGSNVQLDCLADGDPVPTQRWNFNDKQLVLDDKTMSLNADQSVLVISQISPAQFGKYTCLASNIAGMISVSAWVMLYDIPVFIVKPENTIVNESSTLTLHCQGQAVEAPSVSWYRENSGGRIKIENNLRVNINEAGSLQIKSVQEIFDEGWYICVIANSAGNISDKVFVNVQVPPDIIFTNSPQSAVEGSAVNLICQSSGDPTPTLQWIHPSGSIIQSNLAYLMTGHTLNIASTNQNDSGNWTCQYCNQLGCDSTVLQIITEGSPVITSFTGMEDGSLVTLQCEVHGIPIPIVTFTSENQTVNSNVQGHSFKNNRLLIERENLRQEYRCVGQNEYGMAVKTVSVPSPMEAPSVIDVNSRSVTLSLTQPVSMGNLPFTKFTAEVYSDLDASWKPTGGQSHTNLLARSWKITGLQPYTAYNFRVAAENILGSGQFSSPSSEIKTLSDIPSPPVDVSTLQLANNVILLQWQPSEHLNGPKADVVYVYRITKPMKLENSETVIIIMHVEGTLLHNETLQVRLTDLNEPVVYTALVLARNVKMNTSSEAVVISIDQTKIGVGIPEAKPHSDDKSFGTDKVIAVVLGSVGGILFVIIIVFIVTRIRRQKKSESLSLVDHRLSLDQFYMENPKNLYNDTKYSSLRKSCHSFYSFDQEDSFHSNTGAKDSLNGSVIHIGKRKSCEVLLVSKNPLYEDRNFKISSEQKQTEGNNFKESCEQSEIQIPTNDVSVDSTHPILTDTDLADKSAEENVADIYSSIGKGCSKSSTPDTSLDHIYSSIQSDDRLSRCSASSSSLATKFKGDNAVTEKPSDRVVSPENVKGNTESCERKSHYMKGQGQWKNKTPGSINMMEKSRIRNTRSASPEHSVKGHNSDCPKTPTRVLSLDLLSPSVNKTSHVTPNGDSTLKILAGNTKHAKETDEEGINDCDKLSDYNTENKTICDLSGDKNVEEYDQNAPVNGVKSDSIVRECDNSAVVTEGNENSSTNEEKRNSSVSGDTNNTTGPELEDSIAYKSVLKKPKNVIDDNFLTEEEIKRDVSSADLY